MKSSKQQKQRNNAKKELASSVKGAMNALDEIENSSSKLKGGAANVNGSPLANAVCNIRAKTNKNSRQRRNATAYNANVKNQPRRRSSAFIACSLSNLSANQDQHDTCRFPSLSLEQSSSLATSFSTSASSPTSTSQAAVLLAAHSSMDLSNRPPLHNNYSSNGRYHKEREIKLSVCNEDGSVEVESSGLLLSNSIEAKRVYRCRFSIANTSGVDGGGRGAIDNAGIKNMESTSSFGQSTSFEKEGTAVNVQRLGENGWHRVLNGLLPLNIDDEVDMINTTKKKGKKKKQSTETSSPTSTLDELSAIHILQHQTAQLSEYDALQQEYHHLLKEMEALEKDRVWLEEKFHECDGGVGDLDESGEVEKWSYQTFFKKSRFIKSEEVERLPLSWVEELPLSNGNPDEGGAKRGQKHNKGMTKSMEETVRHSRGQGLALLLSDVNAKNSLIGRCYMNSLVNQPSLESSAATVGGGTEGRVLTTEGAAILIPGGGEKIRYVGITGYNNNGDGGDMSGGSSSGTTFFLKFDDGKSYHRGRLPLNLVHRLNRECRDSRALRYLSTGSATVDDGERWYYAEFDSGECWWGTNNGRGEEDGTLYQILMETDVHRVAFGIKSSWIVIGKNGEVAWKSIPQKLHDVLVARGGGAVDGNGTATLSSDIPSTFSSLAAAPCEVSLGVEGAYFVRFSDGTFDYSLPSFVADVCERLEAGGKVIRNVALHVDTYDCLIRYS
eukprot:scaffold1033_cov205-Alexandrium_tamarense.AAC.10